MQNQLEYKHYESIWGMIRKIRQTMRTKDSLYTLSGQIELDKRFFYKYKRTKYQRDLNAD